MGRRSGDPPRAGRQASLPGALVNVASRRSAPARGLLERTRSDRRLKPPRRTRPRRSRRAERNARQEDRQQSRGETSGNALSRICARSRTRMPPNFALVASSDSRNVFRAMSEKERRARPGKRPGAGVNHRRGQRCGDAGVHQADDARIREAASACAALPPRSPWRRAGRVRPADRLAPASSANTVVCARPDGVLAARPFRWSRPRRFARSRRLGRAGVSFRARPHQAADSQSPPPRTRGPRLRRALQRRAPSPRPRLAPAKSLQRGHRNDRRRDPPSRQARRPSPPVLPSRRLKLQFRHLRVLLALVGWWAGRA
jgi:hypothetical protein